MDLIPKPDQVASAASNVAHKAFYGGLADLRPMPRTLIDDGPLREVYHYRPAKAVKQVGDPVLLVTPLAAPALCYDLRRGCSVVEHFVTEGRPTYLVEYGEISFKDRNLGIEHWIDEVLPTAIREVSEHAGGRPVHVVGWSLGGTFSLLTAAAHPDLPIVSLSVLGSPFDVTKVPLVAPLRPLLGVTDGGLVTHLYRLLGGAPKPLVRRAFQLSSFQKLVTKPAVIAMKLDDTEFLAQIEAVDRFTANMIAYPGRTFGQIYHRVFKANELKRGHIEVNGRQVRVEDITAPVLVFGGNTDAIAPINAVRALLPLLTNAAEARFEVVPGGHLGMLTGRASRRTTWRVLDAWMAEHSAPAATGTAGSKATKSSRSGGSARKTAARKQSTKAAAAKQPAKKTTGRKQTARKQATTKATTPGGSNGGPRTEGSDAERPLGANPQRTYSSTASRSLARGS